MRFLLAAISGAVLSLSYRGDHWSIYSWFCIAILLVSILCAKAWVAFVCGFLHGLIFVLTCVSWIAETLSVHGGMSSAAGWGVLLLIGTVWAIIIGTFGWAVERLSVRRVGLALLGAPFFWVTTEVVRAYLPEISFPWSLLGYPAAGNPAIVQLTTVTGIYGVSFLIVAFNALLVWSYVADNSSESKRHIGTLAAAVVVLLMVEWVGPRFVPKAVGTHLARVVQPNFPENIQYVGDWYAEHKPDMADLERLSLEPSSGARQPDLLIWPEAPAPFSFQDPHFGPTMSRIVEQLHHPVVVGVIEWKPQQIMINGTVRNGAVPYNSAAMIDEYGQRRFSYDKIHLVPFGEYEPFPLIHQVVSSVSEEVGGFHKGKERTVGTFSNGNKFSVFICYEAIYAGEVRDFANRGAELFINISNDGWFGTSQAAEQHLRMARVRAVENRRWVIRDTNNGITASIDPYGNVVRVMHRDERNAADLPYDFRTDKTIYTRFGDWFAWMCVIVSVILVGMTFRKGK
ncbi:MAG TPA: apolipoprotein N-acyltransferase [Candidatus Acidoferrum sp.]|nr:apolipoprotein N-acyltransferase [Candidatus Acidoferrum sp.]